MTTNAAGVTKQDRESPAFWKLQRDAFEQYARRPLKHYKRYARRFAGDFREVAHATDEGADTADAPALGNLTNLSVRQARADLYFRNPRFVVRTAGGHAEYGGVFTPALARTETLLLNDAAVEQGLYRHMRKSLLDFLLGPYMVTKVTFACDIGTDEESVREQRDVAQREGQAFIILSTKPTVKETDLHAVHIEEHDQLIAAAERGEIPLPKSAIKYLKKHVQKHREAEPYSRPSETLRNQSIHTRRVNPLCFAFDPFNEDVEAQEWVEESWLARYEDVVNNEEFDRTARHEVAAIYDTDAYLNPDIPGPNPTRMGVSRTPDPRVRMFETIDLVDRKVIIHAAGGTRPLLVRPYTLGSILPSGPYIVSSSMEDPLHNYGVCPPYIYEAHQKAVSQIFGVNNEIVMRSAPKITYNASLIDAETKDALEEFLVAGHVPLKLPPDADVSKVIQQLPPVGVPEQNVAVEGMNRRMIEIGSGQGSARLGGGDYSKTATASAIAGESSSTLNEDTAAMVDDHCRRWGTYQLRLMRQFYSRARVAEIAGPEALQSWPEQFSQRDILMDRGVEVIPGSSRRNTTAVETKLLQDSLAMILPLVGTVIPQHVALEMVRRLIESNGVYGIDWQGAETGMLQMMMAQAEAGMGGAAGGGGGPEGASPRRAEMSEPSASGMMGGMANVGGGRVPTGASEGDAARMMR